MASCYFQKKNLEHKIYISSRKRKKKYYAKSILRKKRHRKMGFLMHPAVLAFFVVPEMKLK